MEQSFLRSQYFLNHERHSLCSMDSQRHYVIHKHLLARLFFFTNSYSFSGRSSWVYVLLSKIWTSKYSLCFRFRHQNPVHITFLPHRYLRPPHATLLDSFTWFIFVDKIQSWSFYLCNFYNFLLPLFRPNLLPYHPILVHPSTIFLV